jgi:hypothetical protein
MESGISNNKFSLENFIKYFLPGSMITFGILVFTKLSHFQPYSLSGADWSTAFLFILISLVAGIIFSGISDQLNNLIYRVFGIEKPTGIFLLKELQGEFIEAFRTEFKIRLKRSAWCEEYFLLMKALVDKSRTSVASHEMTLLKGRLILPVILWTVNGTLFTLQGLEASQNQLILVLSIIAGGYLLTVSLWLNMYKKTVSEVRQTMIAFVALSKSGMPRNDFGIFY